MAERGSVVSLDQLQALADADADSAAARAAAVAAAPGIHATYLPNGTPTKQEIQASEPAMLDFLLSDKPVIDRVTWYRERPPGSGRKVPLRCTLRAATADEYRAALRLATNTVNGKQEFNSDFFNALMLNTCTVPDPEWDGRTVAGGSKNVWNDPDAWAAKGVRTATGLIFATTLVGERELLMRHIARLSGYSDDPGALASGSSGLADSAPS